MTQTVTIAGGDMAMTLLLRERGMPEILCFGHGAASSPVVVERASRINGMDVAVPSAVLLPTGGMGFSAGPPSAGIAMGATSYRCSAPGRCCAMARRPSSQAGTRRPS